VSRDVQLIAADRLRIRQGGGCIALFGLPFFAAGVGLLLAVAGIIPLENAAPGPGLAWLVVSLLGAVFIGVGGTLAFGRTWITIDASARTAVSQAGPLVALTTHTHLLDDYTHVVIGFVRGDSDTSDSFPVTLKGRAGADLPLLTSGRYGEARDCAAAVARLLHVEIEDASTDHPLRLMVDEAGAFPEAAWTRRVPIERAGRPDGALSEVSPETEGVRIVIPHPRAHPIGLALALVPAAIALFFVPSLAEFFRRTRTPDPVAWTFLAFIGLFFVVFPTAMAANAWLRSRRGATIVFVSPRGIRIQERGAWGTSARASIDIGDLLDVDYGTRESLAASARRDAERQAMASHGDAPVGPRTERLLAFLARHGVGGGVALKTHDGLTTFGEALSDEEIRYLYGVVMNALHR
jgi:hypothetical protein